MLTLPQIQSMTDRVIEIMKKSKTDKDVRLPAYHSTYVRSVEMKDAIEIHAVVGVKPDKLVAERAPNQTDKEFKYALANYQQTTLPVFLDTVHTMQRAFSETNWAVNYGGDDENSDLKYYLEQGMKETSVSMSYYDYQFNVASNAKLIDSMGVIAYKPDSIPVITVDGEELIDPQTKFEIIPQYYPSDSILAYEIGKWYFFQTDEKSWVEYGNTSVQDGLVFEVYDDYGIYKVTQVGKKIDYQFVTTLYFHHECGYCPVDRLKGIPVPYGKEILYQSPFLYAVPSLNDVVLDSIMLRSVKAACVFPYRVMTGNICMNKMTINDEIQTCDGTGWFRDRIKNTSICCSTCFGTGSTDRISPHGVLLLKPETAFKEGELKTSQPAMYYVEPSTATPQFLSNQIDKNTKNARNILHLRTTNTEATGKEDLTATTHLIDEKAMISVVKTFRDQMASSVEFGAKTIGIMREGKSSIAPVYTWTNSFDFLTEFEYLQKVSEAIKNGIPSFVVYAELYKYITTIFYDDPTRAKSFELLVTTDRLLVIPYDQINLELAKGLVAPWEVVLHDSGISIIRNLVLASPGFLDQDVAVQRDALIKEAQRLADSSKATLPTSNTNVVDSVLRLAETA